MDVMEKLIEILRKPIFPHELVDPIEAVADYLLDSGVYVEIGNCENCKWKGRHQKCSCCRRNRYIKDCYETDRNKGG